MKLTNHNTNRLVLKTRIKEGRLLPKFSFDNSPNELVKAIAINGYSKFFESRLSQIL
jgi:hypothetical protein